MNDKILFKITDKNDIMIASFWSTAWVEPLKMFSFLKENDLPYDITVTNDDLIDKYKDCIFKIKDISIQFGSNTGINVVDIFVEAL